MICQEIKCPLHFAEAVGVVHEFNCGFGGTCHGLNVFYQHAPNLSNINNRNNNFIEQKHS